MINIFDIKLFSNPFNRLFVGGNFLGDREAELSPNYKLHYRSFDGYNAQTANPNEVLTEHELYI